MTKRVPGGHPEARAAATAPEERLPGILTEASFTENMQPCQRVAVVQSEAPAMRKRAQAQAEQAVLNQGF